MEGRRVANTGEFDQVGDYCVVYDEGGQIISLWMNLPEVGWGRILAEASTEEGPKWTITEDEKGRVTVTPSIECRMPMADGERYFHGFLEAGVWRQV